MQKLIHCQMIILMGNKANILKWGDRYFWQDLSKLIMFIMAELLLKHLPYLSILPHLNVYWSLCKMLTTKYEGEWEWVLILPYIFKCKGGKDWWTTNIKFKMCFSGIIDKIYFCCQAVSAQPRWARSHDPLLRNLYANFAYCNGSWDPRSEPGNL